MKLNGKLIFDPTDLTKKHVNQSQWKKIAVIQFSGDEYDDMWRWYLNKEFLLKVNQNIRGSHITFINDKFSKHNEWDYIKTRFQKQDISVEITNILRGDGNHFWLKPIVPDLISEIRIMLGLTPMPYYPLHYTIGLVNPKNIEESNYFIRNRIRFKN